MGGGEGGGWWKMRGDVVVDWTILMLWQRYSNGGRYRSPSPVSLSFFVHARFPALPNFHPVELASSGLGGLLHHRVAQRRGIEKVDFSGLVAASTGLPAGT